MALKEITQFSRFDFEAFKNSRATPEGQRLAAMEQFDKEVSNPDSALNKSMGGLPNVRRVRVLQDGEGPLQLVYMLLLSERELAEQVRLERIKRQREEDAKAAAKEKKAAPAQPQQKQKPNGKPHGKGKRPKGKPQQKGRPPPRPEQRFSREDRKKREEEAMWRDRQRERQPGNPKQNGLTTQKA